MGFRRSRRVLLRCLSAHPTEIRQAAKFCTTTKYFEGTYTPSPAFSCSRASPRLILPLEESTLSSVNSSFLTGELTQRRLPLQTEGITSYRTASLTPSNPSFRTAALAIVAPLCTGAVASSSPSPGTASAKPSLRYYCNYFPGNLWHFRSIVIDKYERFQRFPQSAYGEAFGRSSSSTSSSTSAEKDQSPISPVLIQNVRSSSVSSSSLDDKGICESPARVFESTENLSISHFSRSKIAWGKRAEESIETEEIHQDNEHLEKAIGIASAHNTNHKPLWDVQRKELEAKTDAAFNRVHLNESLTGWTRQEIFNWPNGISMARLVSGPVLAWMIVQGFPHMAFGGMLLAGISDWLDGHVARRMGIKSVLGSYLDPLADKVLVGSVALSMAYAGLLPPALVALVVARDGALLIGAFLHRAHSLNWKWMGWSEFFRISSGGARILEPLYISKVNTVVQLTLICAALLQPTLGNIGPDMLVSFLSWAVVGTTVSSWLGYAWVYVLRPGKRGASVETKKAHH